MLFSSHDSEKKPCIWRLRSANRVLENIQLNMRHIIWAAKDTWNCYLCGKCYISWPKLVSSFLQFCLRKNYRRAEQCTTEIWISKYTTVKWHAFNDVSKKAINRTKGNKLDQCGSMRVKIGFYCILGIVMIQLFRSWLQVNFFWNWDSFNPFISSHLKLPTHGQIMRVANFVSEITWPIPDKAIPANSLHCIALHCLIFLSSLSFTYKYSLVTTFWCSGSVECYNDGKGSFWPRCNYV